MKAETAMRIQAALLAVVLAALLSFVVKGEDEGWKDFDLPVTVVNMYPGLALGEKLPDKVSVRVEGPRLLLLLLHPEKMQIVLDLSGITEGRTSFPALGKGLDLPPDVKVTRTFPASIDVSLARAEALPSRGGR